MNKNVELFCRRAAVPVRTDGWSDEYNFARCQSALLPGSGTTGNPNRPQRWALCGLPGEINSALRLLGYHGHFDVEA